MVSKHDKIPYTRRLSKYGFLLVPEHSNCICGGGGGGGGGVGGGASTRN